jgi:hypothetical protein
MALSQTAATSDAPTMESPNFTVLMLFKPTEDFHDGQRLAARGVLPCWPGSWPTTRRGSFTKQ